MEMEMEMDISFDELATNNHILNPSEQAAAILSQEEDVDIPFHLLAINDLSNNINLPIPAQQLQPEIETFQHIIQELQALPSDSPPAATSSTMAEDSKTKLSSTTSPIES
jgi:hypothetical protein